MTATDMKIAERIQQLRKSKGLSQEQLAAQLDVSRQAVSKWESGQSVPELDKIILMSNLFETTTDYLLKGVEPTAAPKHRCNAILFSGAGTIINGMGLIIAWMVWVERQTAYAVGIGLILMLLGTGLFLAGQVIGVQNRKQAKPQTGKTAVCPAQCLDFVVHSVFLRLQYSGWTGRKVYRSDRTDSNDGKFYSGVYPQLYRVPGCLLYRRRDAGKKNDYLIV